MKLFPEFINDFEKNYVDDIADGYSGHNTTQTKQYCLVSDALLANRQEIEQHLRETTQSRFNLDRTIMLHDLTNTLFKEACEFIPKARRDHNKQMRMDCPQGGIGILAGMDSQ